MKKITVFTSLCFFTLLAVLTGCNNGSPDVKPPSGGNIEQPKSSEKQILEFMLEEAKIIGLRADLYGRIDETNKTVSVKVPAAATGVNRKKLKVSFKVSSKAKLFVDAVEQESGVTENDFSGAAGVTYTVKAEDGSQQNYTVKVEEAAEQLFSDLPADQQAEIKTLYGYYWADDGNKAECPAINNERLAVYTNSEFMSMGFTNLRWSRISSSMWVCFSYAENDDEEKRIVFTFIKDNKGTLKVWDQILRMGTDAYGPYIKGKEPDKFAEGGKTYYTYDKAAYDKDPKKSPKLYEPRMI